MDKKIQCDDEVTSRSLSRLDNRANCIEELIIVLSACITDPLICI